EENVLMYKAAVPAMYQKAVLKVKRIPINVVEMGEFYRVQIDTINLFTLVAKSAKSAEYWLECDKKDKKRCVIGVEFEFVSREVGENHIDELSLIALSHGSHSAILKSTILKALRIATDRNIFMDDQVIFVGYGIEKKVKKARHALSRQGLLSRHFTMKLFRNRFDVRQQAHPALNCLDMKKVNFKSIAERVLRRDITTMPYWNYSILKIAFP
ncbi:hypothetical protein L195_g013986, partial [Trifolium pratense]